VSRMPPLLVSVSGGVPASGSPDASDIDDSTIGQLAGMAPEQSAALLAQVMEEAPDDMRQQFGDALMHSLHML
jgi:hypothetical protein